MRLFVMPADVRRISAAARTLVFDAEHITPIQARGVARVYRELRRVGGEHGRRGTAVPARQAREIVARLVGIGIIAGHIAEQTIDRPRSLPRSAPTTPVIVPRPPLSIAPFRLVPDAELAVFG